MDCQELKEALARLEAKVDACCNKTINEEDLIKKALGRVFKSGQWIALVGAVGFATSEVAKVRARQIVQEVNIKKLEVQVSIATAKSTTALGKAVSSLTTAYNALDQAVQAKSAALDAISRVAGIVGMVSGLMALYGQLQIIFPQLNALERRVSIVEAREVQTYQIAILARQVAYQGLALAKQAQGTASSAMQVAMQALWRANGAQETANIALSNANSALGQIPPVKELAQSANSKADLAIALAGSALGQLPFIRDLAQGADKKATDASTKAGAADKKATDASTKAGAADKKATDASTKAGAADKRATDASTKAGTADKKATEALSKIKNLPKPTTTVGGDGGSAPDPRVTRLEKDVKQIKDTKIVTKDEMKELLDKQLKPDLFRDAVTAGVLVSLPTLVNATKQGLQQSTPLLTTAAAAGVCKTTAPGGCMGNALDGLGSNIGNNIDRLLNGYNAAANTAQLAMLAPLNAKVNQIDQKLGAKIPGGIGGGISNILGKVGQLADAVSSSFDKVYKALHIDKAVQLLTLAASIHNAAMLSRNVGYTLGQAISNTLAAIGIKDPKTGNPLDINAIIGKQVEGLLQAMLGADNYASMVTAWKKASAIYNSAAQIVWSIQSITYSIQSALEVVGSHVAWIGNALRKFDVVGERAYRWMNPQPNFDNRFFTALEKLETGFSAVDQVSSEALSIQDTLSQLGQQKEDFLKAARQDPTVPTKPLVPEAEATKIAEDQIASVSVARDVLLGAADSPGGV
jgi:hypothetical protein